VQLLIELSFFIFYLFVFISLFIIGLPLPAIRPFFLHILLS